MITWTRTPGISLLCCLFIPFFLLRCKPKEEPEILFRASLWANENHTWYKAFEHFSQLIWQRTKGRMAIEVYPSEQLAKEKESIRLIQAEVIEMTVTASLLSNWIEIAAFCELPFLLKDSSDKNALINGPLGARIEDEILEKTGLRPIALFERGPRQLTCNRPITHPDDLDGLLIRVPSVPSFVTAWKAMGAKPTPMAFSEVFTALQQGTIEAQENPYSLILNAGFAEVQQYVMQTDHVMSWSYVVVGEKQFQRLPEDLKKVFLETAQEMQAYERKLFLQNEQVVKDKLKERGMEFIEVDKEAFGKKCEEAIYNSLSSEMKEVYRDFLESRTKN